MDFALHSLRIGGASTLPAAGEVLERVIQRAERWKSDSYNTVYSKQYEGFATGVLYTGR